jgi:hypothetical protein
MQQALQATFPPYRPRPLPGIQRHNTRKRDRVSAIFATGVQQVSPTINTSASVIWDIDSTSTTTYGPLGSQTTGNVLKDVTIVNTGTATMFVGSGSGVTAVTGLSIPPGGQCTIQGYNITVASSTTGDISAITSAGTTSAVVGLASVASVV